MKVKFHVVMPPIGYLYSEDQSGKSFHNAVGVKMLERLEIAHQTNKL